MNQEVIKGDCVDVMHQMAADSIDLVLTSPPYDSLRDYKGYSFEFEQTANEIYRLLKPGGVCVWVVGDQTINGSETGTSFRQALYFKDIGMNLHDTMIWRKTNPPPQTKDGRRYTNSVEYMFVLSKGRVKTFNALHEPTKNAGRVLKTNITQRNRDGSAREDRRERRRDTVVLPTKQKSNVWDISVGGLKGHPATFPFSLAKDHILSWSNEGDTVLDPFLGSGTTLLACKELNRKGIGIEISEEYCELSRGRLSKV